jgi:PiT family inorganic phosphate transporter
MGLTIIFAGLIGGILWNLLTWLFGIPSSSSHALFGGSDRCRPRGAGRRRRELEWHHLEGADPAVAGPRDRLPRRRVLAPGWSTGSPRNVMAKRREEGFRWGQIATASLVALSHGTNDAQKTMGVIALAPDHRPAT